MIPNQLQFIRRVLYQLKQRYGIKIEYYRVTSTTIDDETGVVSTTKTKFTIKKAIRFPDKRTRGFQYDLSFIAANKNFTMGGTYDRDTRDIVIDRRDLPKGFEPALEDYILINSERYNVKQIAELDEGQGYFLTAEATESEPPNAIHELSVVDEIDLSQRTIRS